MARTPRDFHRRPLEVTAILRTTGEAVPGMVIQSGQAVRDFLLPGPQVTNGVPVESGYTDLICSECGDSARWCPDLSRELPAEVDF